jgi:hypothetical protein
MSAGNYTEVIADGIMTVFYFGRLIGIINVMGEVIWRDPMFPLYLVEYIIENPMPSQEQVRLN